MDIEELEEILVEETIKVKKCFYKSPLPLKKQRVFQRARSGKVKIFSREEIEAIERS